MARGAKCLCDYTKHSCGSHVDGMIMSGASQNIRVETVIYF